MPLRRKSAAAATAARLVPIEVGSLQLNGPYHPTAPVWRSRTRRVERTRLAKPAAEHDVADRKGREASSVSPTRMGVEAGSAPAGQLAARPKPWIAQQSAVPR